LVQEYVRENEISMDEVAAALAKLAQGDRPLLVVEGKPSRTDEDEDRREPAPRSFAERKPRYSRDKRPRGAQGTFRERDKRKKKEAEKNRNFKRPLRKKSTAKKVANE
jgi:ATP-dependent RNA helicase DeaD